MGDFANALGDGLEKIFSSVKSAASVVAQKTKEGATWTRTNIQIQEEESKIKKLFTKLGIRTLLNEGVDEAWEKELKQDYIPSREELLREIHEHRIRISQLKEEMHESNDVKPQNAETAKASEEENVDATWGEVIKPPMSDGVRIFKFCPSCKCGNMPTTKRCIYCGYTFNEK